MDDKSLKKVIAHIEYEKGKSHLQNLEKKQSAFFKPLMLAASILVLLGVFFVWNISNPSKMDLKDIYAENFNTYPNIIAPIKRNVSAKTMEERAFYSYETKDYNIALKTFDSLLQNKDYDKQIIKFYKANIFLETEDDASKAIALLNENLEQSNSWKDKNLWFLSLAYLKSSDSKNALKTLEKLVNSNSTFNKKQRLKLFKQLKNQEN